MNLKHNPNFRNIVILSKKAYFSAKIALLHFQEGLSSNLFVCKQFVQGLWPAVPSSIVYVFVPLWWQIYFCSTSQTLSSSFSTLCSSNIYFSATKFYNLLLIFKMTPNLPEQIPSVPDCLLLVLVDFTCWQVPKNIANFRSLFPTSQLTCKVQFVLHNFLPLKFPWFC